MSLSRILRVLVALAFVVVFVPSSSATPTRPASHVQPGTFSGTTSQGHGIQFNVVEGGANDFIDNWSIGFNLSCAKSGRTPGVGHGFGGFHVDIDPTAHTFKFAYDGAFYFYFQWAGEFTSATAANGTAVVRWGGVFDKRKAELCASGRVTWTANHAAPSKIDPAKFDVFFKVTRGEDGKYKVEQVK